MKLCSPWAGCIIAGLAVIPKEPLYFREARRGGWVYKACFRPRQHSTSLPGTQVPRCPGSFSSGLTSCNQHHARWSIIGQVTPLVRLTSRLASSQASRRKEPVSRQFATTPNSRSDELLPLPHPQDRVQGLSRSAEPRLSAADKQQLALFSHLNILPYHLISG
jgi:hypothetical protein